MMKRIFCIALCALTVLLGLSACGKKPGDASSVSKASSGAGTPSETGGSETAASESSSAGPSNAAAGGSSAAAASNGTAASSRKPAAPGELGYFQLLKPAAGVILDTLTPAFTWEKAESAQSYTLTVSEYTSSGSFVKKFEKAGITATSFKLTSGLKVNTAYRWLVTAVSGNKKMASYSGEGMGLMFLSKVDAKNHPLNKNKNFTFKNTVSKEVLMNYLSRSMLMGGFLGLEQQEIIEEDLRMILYTGAKYLGRANTEWNPTLAYYSKYPKIKENIAKAHGYDPDLVFEACIFECVSSNVNDIPIPGWVFEAFGKPAEKRNFSKSNMQFPDGREIGTWGPGTIVPDITRLETQMFFYYRAATYIDLGFEGLHMGQVHRIGATDSGWATYTKLLKMIRVYAKAHARRGFVFINCHTTGMTGSDGKLMFDFHAYPIRGESPAGSVKHVPSEQNPQLINVGVGLGGWGSIYKKSLGGTTYSGWSCDSLPYFVEFDNTAAPQPELVDIPTSGEAARNTSNWWGMDEITWFTNQPRWYQLSWLEKTYDWIRATDPVGHFEMPGRHGAAFIRYDTSTTKFYNFVFRANNPYFAKDGQGLEELIRKLWAK